MRTGDHKKRKSTTVPVWTAVTNPTFLADPATVMKPVTSMRIAATTITTFVDVSNNMLWNKGVVLHASQFMLESSTESYFSLHCKVDGTIHSIVR